MARRKHDFTDRDLIMTIEGMIRDGADNKQVAEYLHYNENYFSLLVHTVTELSEAIARARRPLSFSVENSLYHRATGMKVKTVTKRWLVGPDGKQTDIEIIQEVESEVPPDPKAIAFWLSQKKPEIWNKQPQKFELSGNMFLDLMKRATDDSRESTDNG